MLDIRLVTRSRTYAEVGMGRDEEKTSAYFVIYILSTWSFAQSAQLHKATELRVIVPGRKGCFDSLTGML